MKEDYNTHKQAFRDNVATLGGLLTFCILGVIQMLTRETFSLTHHIFLILSAVAVPLLATSVSIHYLELPYKKTRRPWYSWWCMSIGMVTGLAAVITAFFTFHWISGSLSIIGCGIGIAVMWGFIDELKDANPEEFEN